MADLSKAANAKTDEMLAALEQTKKDKLRQESESDQANQAKYHRGSSKGNQSQQGAKEDGQAARTHGVLGRPKIGRKARLRGRKSKT